MRRWEYWLLVLWAVLATGLPGCGPRQNATGPSAGLEGAAAGAAVEAKIETQELPTYVVGQASEFPEFVRTSGLQQGPGRAIYPYTFQRDLSFQQSKQSYQTYVLQNEYLRIEVLPSLGGRLFAMYDRSGKQDAVYRQVSIKPALVGLRGAWICGGIEWNFPRSHSVTTFDTVSCQITRHPDGSASIVVGDTERTYRMSWTVEMTLRPGRARLDTRIICRNPTSYFHEGYWWTNAGFPANDQTQLIFPFHKVTGHEADSMSDWPVRDGKDVTWYRDYPGATSTFRAAGEEDFIAAYDHGRDVGLGQYADRNVMPGRKWWSWGVNDSGMRWAKTLSDDNRAYVEIQSGDPLTQSQQFRIQPHQEKQYVEYWMPVTRIGPPARINPEAIVRLTVKDGLASVGVLPTGRIDSAVVELSAGGKVLKQWKRNISPADVLNETCDVAGVEPGSIWLKVFDATGREVIAHQHEHYAQGKPLITPTSRSFEDRLEPEVDKFSAAVAKIRQGLHAQAVESLTALASSGDKTVDAEAIQYFLGLAEAGRGQPREAMKHFQAVKAAGPIRDAAAIEMAKLLLADGKAQEAFQALAGLTGRNPCHVEAEVYAAIALRKSGNALSPFGLLRRALERDPLCLLAQAELALLEGRPLEKCTALRDEERRIEAATAYMAIKQYDKAERLLTPPAGTAGSPTACYLRARVAELAGNASRAASLRKQAAGMTVRNCMPNRVEELAAFDAAIRANDADSSAHYLAGMAMYGCGRKDDAIAHWRKSCDLGHAEAVVYRCLGSVTVGANPAEALKHFQRAVALSPDAAEVYADLDYAHMQLGQPEKRVEALERGLARLPGKDDLAHRLGMAYFDAGRYDDAVKCYQTYRFHVAEGQRDLHDNYAIALVGRAMTHLSAGRNTQALADLDAALEYPENLGIGRSDRARNDGVVQYWRGVVLSKLGQADDATKAWQDSGGRMRPSRRRGFYGPESGLSAVHSMLTLRRLGQASQADDMARTIEDAAARLESTDPPHGKAFAAMTRGLLAAAQGRADEAAKLLDQAQAAPSRAVGYCRLVRTWTELLKTAPATQPAGK